MEGWKVGRLEGFKAGLQPIYQAHSRCDSIGMAAYLTVYCVARMGLVLGSVLESRGSAIASHPRYDMPPTRGLCSLHARVLCTVEVRDKFEIVKGANDS